MGLLDVLSSIANPISSLVGGAINSIGASMTNDVNLKIARETNQLNRQMFDDQLAYNTDMWNKQNAYNDPSAQRKRLEDAGLNPLFFGLDGTGNASGWQSASPVPAVSATMMNPLSGLASGFSDMADSYLKSSQARGQDLDNIITDLTKGATIDSAFTQAEGFKFDNDLKQAEKERIAQEIEESINRIDEIQQRITNSVRALDQADRKLDIDEFEAFTDRYIAENEKHFQDETIKLQYKQLALGYYRAYIENKAVDNQIEVGNAQVSFIKEQTRGAKFANDMNDLNKADITLSSLYNRIILRNQALITGKEDAAFAFNMVISAGEMFSRYLNFPTGGSDVTESTHTYKFSR
ncbi:DNA pilot protein [Dipodfec virus RodF1_17]|uniref:DNA pilot protein n=1 Tax=Dipodfec virus RodF1_17 TaxID=2929293 RepID=A0A976N329_9VIRU|nr:DNA pilot protein [Dipodfec virus RodF1_17]